MSLDSVPARELINSPRDDLGLSDPNTRLLADSRDLDQEGGGQPFA